MAAPLRLCLAVECTQRMGRIWPALLRGLVEPLLAHQGVPGLELALVLFGALPPHSPAVESGLGWYFNQELFRRLLDDLEFVGSGGQPVALADALLEAAALFALPSAGAAPASQHCLVCLASEPAVNPVPWPYSEDCCMAKLGGMVTSVELCHGLRRRGILLGLAGGNLLGSPSLLWHLVNLVSDAPVSPAEARLDQLKQHREGTLQQMFRTAATLPGGAMAVLPSWPQGLEALLQAGAKPFCLAAVAANNKAATSGAEGGGSEVALGGDSLEPLPQQSEEAAVKRVKRSASPLVAAPPASGPSPAAMQRTPPAGAQPTPPTATPGSFLEVLNAEILMSPEEASPMADVTLAAILQPAAAPPALQGPSVTGLPLPPVQQQHHGLQPSPQQQQQLVHGGLVAPEAGPHAAMGAPSKYAVVHTTQVYSAQQASRNPMLLGIAEVQALPQDVAALRSLAWPRELVAKPISAAHAVAHIASKPGCVRTRLHMTQFASPEAQAFPAHLLAMKGAGLINLTSATMGLLLPVQSPSGPEVQLQLTLFNKAAA